MIRYIAPEATLACADCHAEFPRGQQVLRYQGKCFCDEECLSNYVSEQAEMITV